MNSLLGNKVWDEITRELTGSDRTISAISYVGDAAYTLVPLQRGDSIVIDGSDTSLKNGTVSPKVVQRWMKAGVRVYSLSGLHAKIVVAERSDKPSVVILGSANASAASRDSKAEACIVCSDEHIVNDARSLIHGWIAASGPELDSIWLARASGLYQPHRPESYRKKSSLTLSRSRLWIGMLERSTERPSPGTEAAIARTEDRFSNVVVDAWQMDASDLRLMRVGDTVVLAGASLGKTPHGNTKPVRRHGLST